MGDFIQVPQQTKNAPESTDLHDSPEPTPVEALAEMMVHRLFGVGLILQSAASIAGGPAGKRLTRAVEELDAIIRDVRSTVYGARVSRQPGHEGDGGVMP